MITYQDMPVDPNSALYKIYTYFWEFPEAKIIPNEIMPSHHVVYYTYINVKGLREGTDWPPLTLKELEEMLEEEFPNWEQEWEELSDEDYIKLGINIPLKRKADYE